MDFKSRFRGKMTVMNKDGVIGIMNKPAFPIETINQFYQENNDVSPKKKQTNLFTEENGEAKSKIYTNIQISPKQRNQTKYSQKSSNTEKQVIKSIQNAIDQQSFIEDTNKLQKNLQLKIHPDFKQIDMDDYEIIAIPKTMLHQQISVDRYALTHSLKKKQLPEFQHFSPEVTSQYSQNNYNSILKKQYTINMTTINQKSLFNKQKSEKFDKTKDIIQQAGLSTLRYNSQTKR
ncbi:unnamed protein product [Paramecium pentaurelia]|uniref:Uncharacterized protein n=1 Tax=Paramecium pentaurelia TaxID=43138 RepID=A0A8S1Y8M5_9CILI|nr:unnamed protein product [Paramecium pentaurelia]